MNWGQDMNREGYGTTCGVCGQELKNYDYDWLGILMEEHFKETGHDNYTTITRYDHIIVGITPTNIQFKVMKQFKGLYEASEDGKEKGKEE